MSYTFFCKSSSPFSNWNQNGETFELYGQTFNCAEQAMMWCKAWLFGDMEKAKEILASEFPKEQQALGREVEGFDETMWKAMFMQVVYMVLKAKFTQLESYKKSLLDTGDTIMVEASPDKFYGIGIPEAKARMVPIEQWPGKNFMGKIMTKLKKEMISDDVKDFELQDILDLGIEAKVREQISVS
jgi:ribA/ribD-fused uncharacterized protein